MCPHKQEVVDSLREAMEVAVLSTVGPTSQLWRWLQFSILLSMARPAYSTHACPSGMGLLPAPPGPRSGHAHAMPGLSFSLHSTPASCLHDTTCCRNLLHALMEKLKTLPTRLLGRR